MNKRGINRHQGCLCSVDGWNLVRHIVKYVFVSHKYHYPFKDFRD